MRYLLLIAFIVLNSFYSPVSSNSQGSPLPVSPNSFSDPVTMISEGETLLKEGDLVVRLNNDPVSRYIKNFSRQDKSYSHAGIVLFENGIPYIYHIVNGEENPGEKLRKDLLSSYCAPRKNRAFGIFRYDMNDKEIKKLKEVITGWYAKGIQFETAFNLKTDDKMYCSEMVMKALVKATRKRILIETVKPTAAEAGVLSVHLRLPFAYTNSIRVVPIDNLYLNPSCHMIKEYNFKPNK
ncbi:MAG TPA: YiiX/YebB-like N1pC/P60 family cysteine hydrolase [Chitinophagaceae bacterium]